MKTYKQQFDAITEAYIHNRLRPIVCEQCFIGNMLDNKGGWQNASWYVKYPSLNGYAEGKTLIESYGYTVEEIDIIENAFLSQFDVPGRNHEDGMYAGMVNGLEVLRQIHLAKGDETAQPITLQKRTLCAAQ